MPYGGNQLQSLCQSARAAITKSHKMGDLNNKIVSSHSSGAQKYKNKVLASLISPEASLGLQMTLFSLCAHMTFSLCTHITGVPSSYEDTSLIGLLLHLTLITSLKVLSPNTVTLGIRNVLGETIQSIAVSMVLLYSVSSI